jgi:hypothetical protein
LVSGTLAFVAARATAPPSAPISPPAAAAAEPPTAVEALEPLRLGRVMQSSARASREQLDRESDARVLIDDAKQAQRWGAEESEKLRSLLRAMAPEQRLPVMRQLMIAINTGAVTLEGDAPPL